MVKAPDVMGDRRFDSCRSDSRKKKGEKIMAYTIRSAETGAVIMTGYVADSADEALDKFYADYPQYDEGEAYASESGWND